MLKLLLIPLLSITSLTLAETPFNKRDLFSPFDPKDTPTTFTKDEIENAKNFVPSLPDISSNYLGKRDPVIKPFTFVRPSKASAPSVKSLPDETLPLSTVQPFPTETTFPFPTSKPVSSQKPPYFPPRKPYSTKRPSLRFSTRPRPTLPPSFLDFSSKLPSTTTKASVTSENPFNFVAVTPKPLNTYVVTPKPLNTYSITPKPYDPFDTTPKPFDTFAITPKPFDTFARTPRPFETFAITPRPIDTFSRTPKPFDTFAMTPKPSDILAITPKPFDTFPVTPKPFDTFFVTPKPFNTFPVTPKPFNTFVGPKTPLIKEPFEYDYIKSLSAELAVGDNFFGESETTSIFDNSEEHESPIRGNVYYYFYPVKRVSQKKKSPFNFRFFGSNEDNSVREYPNSVGYEDGENTQGAFGLFKIGFLKLLFPLLIFGGFMFLLSSLTIELSVGQKPNKQRSLDNSINHSVKNVEEEIEKLFENYISILDSEECLKKIFCEGALIGKGYSLSSFLIRFFESYVPSEKSKSLNIVKSAILNAKNDQGCQIFTCKLPESHRKVYSEEKRRKQKKFKLTKV